MTKVFAERAVRFFAVFLIFPALISCGSGGGGSKSEGESSPTSTEAQTTTDNSAFTDTPALTPDPVPAANPVPPTNPGSAGGGGGPSSEAAMWQSLGDRINTAQGGKAVWLTLATSQNAPAVAWEEEGKIYAAFWNGRRWSVEGPLNVNPDEAASLPSLATDDQELFLTWIEGRSLYLMRREWNGWTLVAIQTDQDGCGPANAALDVRQGVPTVAWDSFCSDSRYASTRVQQWAGVWVDLDGVGEHYADAPSPRKYALGSNHQTLSLAVLMQNAASEGVALSLFHRTEESWVPAGGPANDPLAFFSSSFSLAFIQNIPTLAFQQGGIQAKQWNGEGWVALGAPLSREGVDPALIEEKGNPTLAFGGSSVEVWGWNGTAWTQKGEDLNQTSDSFSWSTSLAASEQRLYAAWIENGFIFVKAHPIQ